MELKRTPLFEAHRRLGARLIDFGGWEMPVQYSGIVDEHLCVRRAAGIFDISHMGRLAGAIRDNELRVQWALEFKPWFIGWRRQVYLQASDAGGGSSDWVHSGVWKVR